MITAHSIGIWNMRLKATALPSTSARSHAPMAISQNNQLGQRVHAGYQSRQHWARSLPVTTPSRAEMTCMKIAIKLASAHDPKQSVFELRAARQVGAPIARIHVTDADENRRPDKRPPLPPKTGLMGRHFDAPVHSFQRKPFSGARARGSFLHRARILQLFTHANDQKTATAKNIRARMFFVN